MRELHGVATLRLDNLSKFKAHLLLVDKLHLIGTMEALYMSDHSQADLAFLRSRELIDPLDVDTFSTIASMFNFPDGELKHMTDLLNQQPAHRYPDDLIVRMYAAGFQHLLQKETVAICEDQLNSFADKHSGSLSDTVLRVSIEALPLPGEDSAWQDVLDFKAEMHDKQWAFRRFLHDIAGRSQTEIEIRDDIEWTINEYTRAMKIHDIKASQSFVDVFVISPLEIIENLVQLNWSKIAKGALSVQKLKVELLEAEMNAPGRECAYVFDARKRFGPK